MLKIKNGFHVLYYDDNTTILTKGNYINGKKDGYWLAYCHDNSIIKNKNGKHEWYYGAKLSYKIYFII